MYCTHQKTIDSFALNTERDATEYSTPVSAGVVVPAGNRIGSVNDPKMLVGTKKCAKLGFTNGSYESEYEVCFDLTPRNGQLPPSDPETQEPLTLRSGPKPET